MASPPLTKTPTATTSSPPSELDVLVEVYDLLPPGKLSTTLWVLSCPLVHTSVHIPQLGLELAYGAHDHPGVTGVYTTVPPLTPPPGGARHRRTLRLGTIKEQHGQQQQGREQRAHDSDDDARQHRWAGVAAEVDAVTGLFKGAEYNLLTRNCNHFSDHLARRLTGKGLPGWCNRAARLGVALPCLVPEAWVVPPTASAVGNGGADVTAGGAGERKEDEHGDGKGGRGRGSDGKKNGEGGAATSQGPAPAKKQPSSEVVGVSEVTDEQGRSLPPAELVPGNATKQEKPSL